MYRRGRSSWLKHLDFVIIDLVAIVLCFGLAYLIRFPGLGLPFGRPRYRHILIVMSLMEVLSSLMLGNLRHILRRGGLEELLKVILVSFATLALSALYMFSTQVGDRYSRLLLLYTIILFVFVDFGMRSLWKHIVLWFKASIVEKSNGSRSILIVTDKKHAKELLNDIKSDTLEPFRIKGFILTDASEIKEIEQVPVVGTLATAANYICRDWVDEVLMFLTRESEDSENLIRLCAEMGVTVHMVLSLKNVDRNKQFIEKLGSRTVVTTAFNYMTATQSLVKRCFDIIGGLVGTLITVLVGLVIGPIIYAKSKGPIIFKQKRIGKNGKQFNMYKFRSMYMDAEERKQELMNENRVKSGMMFKMDFDPRIIGNEILPDGTKKTGIGEFIRKTSLDELPQFINVLKGDMALVGTRPPTIDEWEKYEYHHRARLSVKPGMTGMWQVSGRSEITDFEEVVKLDTEYICNFKIGLDVKILLKTVVSLFKKEGAM